MVETLKVPTHTRVFVLIYLAKVPLVTNCSATPPQSPNLSLSEHQRVSQASSITDLISEPQVGLQSTSYGLSTSCRVCAPFTQRTRKEGKRKKMYAGHTETSDRACLPKTAAPTLVPHELLTTWGGQSSSDPGVCFFPLDLGALDPQSWVPHGRDPHLEVHLPGSP